MSKGSGRSERPPVRRRRRLTLRWQRRPLSRSEVLSALGLVCVVFGAMVMHLAQLRHQWDFGIAAEELSPSGGDVRVATKRFDDGLAHFFRRTTSSGREVRFFVIKSSEGVIHAAFDSCERCYKERRGYRQAGPTMVCNFCGRSSLVTRIGVDNSGCNPILLESSVLGGQLLLKAVALDQGGAYF